ncbi:MAG: zinc ribbon domain-containing protein [Promethearchaeota archaeon]
MGSDFKPYSSPIPIAGTSYSAQIGKNQDDKWVVRLIKARQVVESEVFDELNGNSMVGFILRATAIPMLNPYKISQNVKMLITQAERGPLQEKPPAPPPATAAAPSTGAGSGSLTAGIPRASEYDIPPPGAVPSQAVAPQPAAVTGSNCPLCNSPIQPNWNLCAFCGQELKQLNCPACGKKINFSFKLCPYCGITLR